MGLTVEQKNSLLELAKSSVKNGLNHSGPIEVNVDSYDETLKRLAATFVTLTICGQLRGCIGLLEASRPMVEDVAANAFAAAFEDPRFPKVTEEEWLSLKFHISILTEPKRIKVSTEDDLLDILRPSVDGLILEEGRCRATFLPSVWESLPRPTDFVKELKSKAGWSEDYWSPKIQVQVYQVEEFGDE